MRRASLLCLLLCLLTPVVASATTAFTGRVVAISDGDTLSVLRDGKTVTVRLRGIDTPEKGQPFGTQAKKFTGDLVFQQDVAVAVHATDRYNRLVGDVLLRDGRRVSFELVRAGLAWWYRQYAPADTTLAQLEAEARLAQVGLWSEAHPVAPWQWRQEQRLRAACRKLQRQG